MAKQRVELYNSFEEWRLKTNLIADSVSDVALVTGEETARVSSITASISGYVMTVTAITGSIKIGSIIEGLPVEPNTHVVSFGTGTGGTGTYNVSVSQTVVSSALTSTLTTASRLQDLYDKKVKRSGDTFTGPLQVNSTLGSSGIVSITNATASTSTSTGALVVTGGVGVGGVLRAGSVQATPIGSTTASTGAFTTLTASSTVTLSPANSAVTLSPSGTGTVTISPVGALTINPTTVSNINNTNIGATTRGTGAFTTLTANGITTITNATASTSAVTGALVVTGGVGITNNLFVTGTSNFAGLTTHNGTITSTLGTITTSKPILTATQTWNNAGTQFIGINADITATAASSTSLLMQLRKWDTGSVSFKEKLTIDVNGSIGQYLAGTYLSRTVLSGTRGIREYQDLTDDGRQGLPGVGGISTDSFEWGFTWNAKWDGVSSYVKDRSNAGDHAAMMRLSKTYKQQWWFSDGTAVSSPIAWVKKIDFDLPANTYTFVDGANSSIITPTSISTATVHATDQLIVGSISYFDAITAITATTSQTVIASFTAATFRSATFEIQATDSVGLKYHKTNLSFIHDGTNSSSVEFGAIAMGGTCAVYSTRLNAGLVEILATPTSTNSTNYKIHARLMGV